MRQGRRNDRRDISRWRVALAVLPAWALPAATMAQNTGSVSEYRLPPGPSASGAPAPAGPVDPEVPVVQPTRAPSTDAAQPSPRPAAPVIVLPTPERPAQSPAQGPVPRPQRSGRTEAERAPAIPATPVETPTAEPAPLPSLAPEPAPAVSDLAPAAAPEPEAPLPWLAILAGLGALVALGVLARLLRRRKTADAEPDEPLPAERPGPPAPEPSAPAALPARPSGITPPRPFPTPSFHPGSPLELTLEANAFNRSLVYATLSYRLHIANASGEPLGPLRVAADLASAHASLSAAEQLSPDGEFAAHHDIAVLAPGETASVTGSLRLPLAALRPIHQGLALLFVPLVRVRVESGGDIPAMVRVFVVGEPGPHAALRPFRLDTMPGTVRHISQREITLDAVAGAG